MRLTEQITLTVPVDRADGSVIWVHATPISREVFEQHWLVLSKAFAGIYGEGLGMIAGPRIAALMLKHVATDLKQWDGPSGVELSLMPEIRRLANVVAPGGPSGWQIVPLEQAIAQQMIDAEDAAEVEGVLVFFTLAWRLHRQAERLTIITGAAKLWGASTSSQTLSAFVHSLRTSKETDNTGETVPVPLSRPSLIGPQGLGSNAASGTAPATSPGDRPRNSATGT